MSKAKFRQNALTSSEVEIEWREGDSLQDIFNKVCDQESIPSEVHRYYHILLEGHIVDRKMWNTRPHKNASVLVAAIPEGGSGRSIFKQVAVLAVVTAVSYFLTPYAGAALAGAIGSVAGIATSMALNSLMPEPLPGEPGLGGDLNSDIADSQMYTINAQSNKVAKYRGVPKVYGTFRFFPNVAANPYTELGADISTGELVQYLVAIYDFGHGPMSISELKIGETPIEEFADLEYRLVDPNMPSYSEDDFIPDWDKGLNDSFSIYTGDSEMVSVSASLTANRVDVGADPEDFQAVRAVVGDPIGSDQDIIVTLACPRGLDSINTSGTHFTRSIELDLEFAEQDSEDWMSYSDVDFVDFFDVTGAIDSTIAGEKSLSPPSVLGSDEDFYFENFTNIKDPIVYTNEALRDNNRLWFTRRTWRYKFYAVLEVGETSFIAQDGINALGDVKINGINIGGIESVVSLGGGYSRYFLIDPISTRIILYTGYAAKRIDGYGAGPSTSIDWHVAFAPENPATVKYQYRNGSIVTLSGSTNNPIYCQVKFRPKKKSKYKVRLIRNRTYSQTDYVTYDDLTWTTLEARYQRPAIVTNKRHTFLELRIRATNQLNGTIQNLSGVVQSVLNVYDENTSSWSLQITNNPAWVFVDLLTGQINKRAVSFDRLDLDSILEWRDYCNEIPPVNPDFDNELPVPRVTCNFTLDYSTTLQEVVNQVTSAGQASLNLIDGKYGILIDKKKDIPVQIFTERNSWGFSSSRNYADLPNELRVKYTNYETWQIDEISVFRDGYDEFNSESYEEMNTFACTSQMQAWRFGRYAIAAAELRQENISIQVDFEHLVCTRGDYVQITQNVMKVGGMPARVSNIDGNIVSIDAKFSPEVGKNYGYTFRPTIGNPYTGTMTIVSPNQAQLDGDIPDIGDLIIWGEIDHITFDCLVKGITPNDNLSATLMLIEKADEIFDAEVNGTLPVYNPNLNSTSIDGQAPEKVNDLAVVENFYDCLGASYQYFIKLTWLVPEGSVYEAFEVYVDYGQGFTLADTITRLNYKYIVDSSFLGVEHRFKVIAVSESGQKLSLPEVDTTTATPTRKISPPGDVEYVNLNVTSETVQIDWPSLRECDVKEYLIRYTPTLNGTWEDSIPLQRVTSNTTLTSAQARTGTYLIKAVDFNDNESENAAIAITSIPQLENLNIIDETNDFPDLLGEKDRVVKQGNYLILQEESFGNYFAEGTYYYDEFLDLGDIFTVRLQSSIRAEGFTPDDIMSSWETLSEVLSLSSSRFSEWDVETWYRATDAHNVMSEWLSMSDIDPISEGVQDNWTPWRKFTMGDFSGRIFQFKLVLRSFKANVTPRVFDGIIKADMPDRRDIFNNLISDVSGTNINYTHPFKGPGNSPVVTIGQDNAQQGDYYQITDKTLEGFTITFYDSLGVPVVRQFDVAAQGYGRKTDTVI